MEDDKNKEKDYWDGSKQQEEQDGMGRDGSKQQEEQEEQEEQEKSGG